MTKEIVVKTPEQQHSNFLYKQAEVLSNTDIVPSHLRGKPAQIYAIVSIGDTLGIPPATAVQSFASINGQVTMSAELMRALILGQGHSITFTVSTRTECVIKGRRKDTGDECVVEYTLEDAQIAGLCQIKDGKAYARSREGKPLSWEKYPRQLLAARATTELARLLFPDVIKGVSYTPEELGWSEEDNPQFQVEDATIEGEAIDVEPVEAETVEQPTEHRVEHEQQEKPDGHVYVQKEPSKPTLGSVITDAQMRKIMAMKTRWVTEKPHLAKQVDEWYEITHGDKSHKNLTKKEASEYIEYLVHLEEGEQ